VEQDHQAINARARPMLGFKAFANAARTIAGIELVHRIRKGQYMSFRRPGPTPQLSMRAAWNLALA
jgi:transposase-like protein